MEPAHIKPRVLVVDDNVDAADVLAQLLESLGLDAAVAHSGVEAVAAVRTFRPTVVLLDLNMPRMDGFETASALREKHSLRIVAYSADNSPGTLRRIADADFDGRLTKPAGLVELLEAIHAGPSAQA